MNITWTFPVKTCMTQEYLKQKKNPHKELSNFLTVCVFSSVIHLCGKIQVSLDNVAGMWELKHMSLI